MVDNQNPADVAAMADEIIGWIEDAGGDVKKIAEHPLGKAAVEQVSLGRYSPEEFRTVIRKLLFLNPGLKREGRRAIPLPPTS